MLPSRPSPLALVTGASGFIGSHLAAGLIGRGWRVRAMARRTSDLRWLKGLELELAFGSFDDPASLADAVRGVDYVFHNAAAKSGSWQRLLHDNVEATVRLAEAAARSAPGLKRFVFLSSQAAAGPALGLVDPKGESHRCLPVSDYGRSKLEAEQRLTGSAGSLPVTIIRPPTVYGPRDADVYLYFQWIDRGLALLPGFRKRYAQVIYVEDLVDGIMAAAESKRAIGRTYFLSDPQSYSWQDISSAIAKSLGRRPFPVHLPLGLASFTALLAEGGAYLAGRDGIFTRQKVREMSQRYWTCSPRRAGEDFGFQCRHDLESGIAATARWYQENGWL